MVNIYVTVFEITDCLEENKFIVYMQKLSFKPSDVNG